MSSAPLGSRPAARSVVQCSRALSRPAVPPAPPLVPVALVPVARRDPAGARVDAVPVPLVRAGRDPLAVPP